MERAVFYSFVRSFFRSSFCPPVRYVVSDVDVRSTASLVGDGPDDIYEFWFESRDKKVVPV